MHYTEQYWDFLFKEIKQIKRYSDCMLDKLTIYVMLNNQILNLIKHSQMILSIIKEQEWVGEETPLAFIANRQFAIQLCI